MGMFDDFEVIGKHAPEVVCAAGHPLRFQTKSLWCDLLLYRLDDDHLTVDEKGFQAAPDEYAAMQERLDKFTGSVEFYSGCDACRRDAFVAVYKNGVRQPGAYRQSFRPWCEWVALFDMGRLVVLRQVQRQTVDEMIAEESKPIERHDGTQAIVEWLEVA